MFALFKIYNITWQYVSIPDFLYITIAQSAAFFILAAVIWNPFISNNSIPIPIISSFLVFPVKDFPRSILFIDCIMSLSLVCGLRISKRVFLKYVCRRTFNTHGKNTLVIGAGNTGSMIIRDLKEGGFNGYRPIGLLDDEEQKVGKRIHGVPVLGTTEKLKDVIETNRIHVIIIAIPSLNHKTLRKLYNSAKEHNVEIKIIPRIYDYREPAVNIYNLEDISVEDLLGREAVNIDHKGIEQFIHNKRVLITGAGGSIGSEIAMQVCSFHPEKVILLDNDETELHHLELVE